MIPSKNPFLSTGRIFFCLIFPVLFFLLSTGCTELKKFFREDSPAPASYPARSQSSISSKPLQKPLLRSTANNSSSDVLRVGDLVNINLTGVPPENTLNQSEKVDGEGNISMPFLGKFRAAGKTISQVKEEIEAAYRNKRIFATPNISINFQTHRFINVMGEVRMNQRVPFTNDLTALSALSACGGFTEFADRRKIRILRNQRVFIFDWKKAIRNPKLDIKLQAGDKIEVRRTIW